MRWRERRPELYPPRGLALWRRAATVLLVFALFLYRRWNLAVAMLAGAAAGVAMAINDLILYYPGADTPFAIVYTASAIVSGAVIAGLLSWLLVRALARTGALSRFAAGRDSAVRV
jgi:energy-coupling factor transport system substrate-specific component